MDVPDATGFDCENGPMAFQLRKGQFCMYVTHETRMNSIPSKSMTPRKLYDLYQRFGSVSKTRGLYHFSMFWNLLAHQWDYDMVCASFLAWAKAVQCFGSRGSVMLKQDLTFKTVELTDSHAEQPWNLESENRFGPYLGHILLRLAAGKNMTEKQLKGILALAQELFKCNTSTLSYEQLQQHDLFQNVRHLNRLPLLRYNLAREFVVTATNLVRSNPVQIHKLLADRDTLKRLYKPMRITFKVSSESATGNEPGKTTPSDCTVPPNLPFVCYPTKLSGGTNHDYASWGIQIGQFRPSDPLWTEDMSARVMRAMLESQRSVWQRTKRFPLAQLDRLVFTAKDGLAFAASEISNNYEACLCSEPTGQGCWQCQQRALAAACRELLDGNVEVSKTAQAFLDRLHGAQFPTVKDALADPFVAAVSLSDDGVIELIVPKAEPETSPAPVPRLVDRLARGIGGTPNLLQAVLCFALMEVKRGRSPPIANDIYVDAESRLYRGAESITRKSPTWRNEVLSLITDLQSEYCLPSLPPAILNKIKNQSYEPEWVLRDAFFPYELPATADEMPRVRLTPETVTVRISQPGPGKGESLLEVVKQKLGISKELYMSVVDAACNAQDYLQARNEHLSVNLDLGSIIVYEDGSVQCTKAWVQPDASRGWVEFQRSLGRLSDYMAAYKDHRATSGMVSQLVGSKFTSTDAIRKQKLRARLEPAGCLSPPHTTV